MRGWVKKFTGEYLETQNNVSFDGLIAVEVPLMPSPAARREIKIQKEMNRLLREQAIKNLGLTPEPIPLPEEEPDPIIITPVG